MTITKEKTIITVQEPTSESFSGAAQLLHLSSSPHIRQKDSVPDIMRWVVIALIPSFIASILIFGLRALEVTLLSVCSAVFTEWLIVKLMKKKPTINNFSAVITGLLLGFSLSPLIPWWMVIIGAAFSICVAKMAFGGLGGNFLNPALAGRAFLMASYPTAMTQWLAPRWGTLSGTDAVTNATPLINLKTALSNGSFNLDFNQAIPNLLLGNTGGCVGETSVIALVIGAVILWSKKIIGFRIPLSFIGVVFILSWIFNGSGHLFTYNAFQIPLYQILAGGVMLGALFMATDPVTSPITPKGQLIFGAGCGVLTFLIRTFGGYPDGAAYSILLMNLVVPFLDRYARPKIYGEVLKRD
jgi:electron transport complex protein RnfD